ncbi:MAG: LPS export ABC transporter periplasmic protein LptC [Synechococcaceae cyanobacterium]|nr:LPS export ABC transporter periplasmic protein LptC [Synechococcaceae cyanobacterium]
MRPPQLLPASLGALLLAACQPSQPVDEPIQPFVFRSLELRQKDRQGRPLWEISSPEARYDLSRKLAHARELRGTIYAEGRPLYRVSASRGVVLNDGQVVLLEGPTAVRRLGKDPVLIEARRLRWYPQRGTMELDRQPLARQGSLAISAGRAQFDFNRDRLLLRDSPVLVHHGQVPLRLDLSQVTWWAGSGAIEAQGPVRGERRGSGGERQQLSSPSLRGNSLNRELILAAPVRVSDAARRTRLTAAATRVDLQTNRISSAQPFSASYGSLNISGASFALLPDSTTLEIPRGCRLNRAGEALEAHLCRWNWRSNQVQARGEVRVQRQAQQLTTRAAALDGRISSDGVVVFSRPGGTVQTQLRLAAPR